MGLASGLAVWLGGVCAAGAQSADAFVTKIPGAGMPSTVTFSGGSVSGIPGKAVSVPFRLALAGTAAPTSFQFDLTFDPTKLTYASSSAGLTVTMISASDVRFIFTGGQTGLANGMVAYAKFTLASPFTVTSTAVTPINCMSTNLGAPLSTGCSAGSVSAVSCNVSGDASASVADVQSTINQVLGVAPAVDDLNLDGVVNVADIQIVTAAAMGKGCVY